METSVQGTVSLEQGMCCDTSPVSSRHGSGEYLCWDRSGFCQDMSFLGLLIKEQGHVLPRKQTSRYSASLVYECGWEGWGDSGSIPSRSLGWSKSAQRSTLQPALTSEHSYSIPRCRGILSSYLGCRMGLDVAKET